MAVLRAGTGLICDASTTMVVSGNVLLSMLYVC